ncbi:hypothetical protein PIB30_083879, partial [Stylosanthes scabra]|nr:hypothetical protein [Stylosanthes scabra]
MEELKRDLTMLAHFRATHMRRTASICVEGKLILQASSSPRICVEASIYVENIQAHPPRLFKTHAYAQNSKHMRGRQAHPPSYQDPRIAVE